MVEMNWDFETEDFGLASSFSSAPVFAVSPEIAARKHFIQEDNQHQAEEALSNEIRSDGFCFKLAPVDDQVNFQRHLKKMAPKMTDFSKGTTTLAFEFQEGVLIAVDARATQGSFISSN